MPERDASEILLGLLAPAALGEEVVPGARLIRVSTEIGLRLTIDFEGRDVSVLVAPLELARRYAASSSRFAFSYVSAEGIEDASGRSLCQALAARASSNEEAVLAELASVREGSIDAPRLRRVRVETLLEPAGGDADAHFHLSPYVGCLIGCRFCYAQSHLAAWRALVGLPDAPWGSYVEVRENAPEVLREELKVVPIVPIKFCPIVSDPYHSIEEGEGLTRRCLEVLREAPRRDVLVLTRGALVRRDIGILGELHAHLGVSLPTVDDEVRAHFEPRGATIDERLAILREARAAGVRTFAVVQPLLPGSVDALADALAFAVTSARVDVLHGVEGAGGDFAHPDYVEAKEDAWQADRAAALASALAERGVAVWSTELPPDL